MRHFLFSTFSRCLMRIWIIARVTIWQIAFSYACPLTICSALWLSTAFENLPPGAFSTTNTLPNPSLNVVKLIVIGLFFRCKWTQKAWPSNLHQVPNVGAGKGISHEPLPDQAEKDRDGARPVPDGETDQNLVPKQADEAEKRDSGRYIWARCLQVAFD